MTTAGAVIGAGAIAWPFIDFMEPSADVVAAGAPIDIDLSKIAAGQQIVVLWRGAPMLIVDPTPSALKTLQAPDLVSRLSDPKSSTLQQPPYAVNWHRSVKPEYAVLVGICTHLGCLPNFMPSPDPTTPVANWPGGISVRVTARNTTLPDGFIRVFPVNLPVPPYRFVDDKTVRMVRTRRVCLSS